MANSSTLQVVSVEESAPAEVRTRAPRQNWTAEDTLRLVDTWGPLYEGANRGHLPPGSWQEVTDAVNANKGLENKRTLIQCKNRMDSLKKKYKVEKAKTNAGNGTSKWPLFSQIDKLVRPEITVTDPAVQSEPVLTVPAPPLALPLPLVAIAQSTHRENYSGLAAAAAAAAATATAAAGKSNADAGQRDEVEEVRVVEDQGGKNDDGGIIRLAKAIKRFADVYEKVHNSKKKQKMELEIKKLEIAKDRELQKSQQMLDAVLKLQQIWQEKHRGSSDDYMVY